MKHKLLVVVVVLVLVVVAVAACSFPRAAAAVCPEATDGTEALTIEEHGYCLLYPSGYSVERPSPDETVLVVGSLLNVSEPRVYIEVSDAKGRSVESAGDTIVANYPGFEIKRRNARIGNQDAVVLDGVPGQDISRQALIVHRGRLYQLTFVPANQDDSEVYAQMDELYQTVIGSLRFSQRGR